ncbi:MAG: hypothetical protein GTN70_11860 [Deltaproteobacteria bacterium]|nr:hypothetical protein [Deltaproteobacteria bacterium]NIS78468.1 hypothetical protein [Deltaproteobacteria bacterium]
MLNGKKAIAFGDGQEIKGESLKKCLEAAGTEVILVRDACFV